MVSAGVTNGTANANAQFGIGFNDGVDQAWSSVQTNNNQALSHTSRRNDHGSGTVGQLTTGSVNVDGELSVDQFIAGGQRYATLNATVDTVVNVDPGFAWRCCFVVTCHGGIAAASTGSEISVGFYDKDNDDFCYLAFNETHNTASHADTALRIDHQSGANGRVGAEMSLGVGAIDYSIDVAAGTGTSADFWPRTNGGDSDEIFILFLGGFTEGIKILDWDSPSATGSDAHTGVGFAPQAMFTMHTFATALDTAEADAQSGAWAFSLLSDDGGSGVDEFCMGYSTEDNNPGNTDTSSLVDTRFMNIQDDSGLSTWVTSTTTAPTLDADGWTATFDTVADATARKQVSIFFEETTADGTTFKMESTTGQFPNGADWFDVTLAGETRLPTGAVFVASEAETLNTQELDAVQSIGATDFQGNSWCCSYSDEDAVATTDCHRGHTEAGDVIQIYVEGTTTINVSATAVAIPGGVRIIPGESSTNTNFVQVTLIFGTACKAYSTDGDGSIAVSETFTVAHGMTTAPGAGIHVTSYEDETIAGADATISLGFHTYDDATIVQVCQALLLDNAVTTTSNHLRHASNRSHMVLNTSGSAIQACEITAIDTTNVTFTQRSGTMVDKYCGLLIECDGIQTEIADVLHPTTAASDWNVNDFSFQAQFAWVINTRMDALDNNTSGSNAGTFGLIGMNADGTSVSAVTASDDGRDATASNTNTESHLNNNFFTLTDGGATHASLDNHTFTTDGWDVLAADITTATTGIRYYSTLIFEVAAAGANTDIAVPTGPLR
jgi:hypothetical protein